MIRNKVTTAESRSFIVHILSILLGAENHAELAQRHARKTSHSTLDCSRCCPALSDATPLCRQRTRAQVSVRTLADILRQSCSVARYPLYEDCLDLDSRRTRVLYTDTLAVIMKTSSARTPLQWI